MFMSSEHTGSGELSETNLAQFQDEPRNGSTNQGVEGLGRRGPNARRLRSHHGLPGPAAAQLARPGVHAAQLAVGPPVRDWRSRRGKAASQAGRNHQKPEADQNRRDPPCVLQPAQPMPYWLFR